MKCSTAPKGPLKLVVRDQRALKRWWDPFKIPMLGYLGPWAQDMGKKNKGLPLNLGRADLVKY